ncbi:MAG: bifunctional riboflavin kinase/FAD synthetase [Bacilli bacterium]|nr:bifunctional riboflavin kinase/FAD synthetase [Bacilli bacterium]
MRIIHLRNNEYLNIPLDEYAIAIGNFDGIHYGHQEVINTARKLALKKGLKFGVMCFDITPRQVVNDIDNYYLLRSFEQKKKILEKLDVEVLFLLHFNKDIKDLSPEDFIKKMIINNHIKYLVCGYDFHFGKNQSGDVNTLQKYDEFHTIIIPRYEINHQRVSSTLIHELIMNGDIEAANKLLICPYSIIGKVIEGNKKGQSIGFPTANIKPLINYRIPQSGVYATKTIINNKEYYSMTNIGHNPTFNFVSQQSIETNIFAFDEDIYGAIIEIVFIKFIRKERIFENIASLVKQLRIDKEKINDYFNNKGEL